LRKGSREHLLFTKEVTGERRRTSRTPQTLKDSITYQARKNKKMILNKKHQT
jgi:hypothetical protein